MQEIIEQLAEQFVQEQAKFLAEYYEKATQELCEQYEMMATAICAALVTKDYAIDKVRSDFDYYVYNC